MDDQTRIKSVLIDLFLYTIELEKRLVPYAATRGYVRFPDGAHELGKRVRSAVGCGCDPEYGNFLSDCPIHSEANLKTNNSRRLEQGISDPISDREWANGWEDYDVRSYSQYE